VFEESLGLASPTGDVPPEQVVEMIGSYWREE
jgi:hypothetical protein